MSTFGQRLAIARKEKNLSQRELSKLLGKTFSIISKYERDEVNPSLEMIKHFSSVLNVPVFYLVDDSGEYNLLKNKDMIQRLKEIETIPEKDQEHIFYAFDSMLRDVKARLAYNK
jgi:transcriptional regulator with XRE-family HTH domain